MYIFQNTKQRVLDFRNLNGISDELNLCNNGKKYYMKDLEKVRFVHILLNLKIVLYL